MSGYDKFVRGKVLGKGSFGQAVLVTNKVDGKNYVIKEIDVSRMPKAEREASEQEAKLLMALSHPNIVRCLESFTHQNKLCIVMDWCSEGDLYGICQKRRGSPLPEDTIMDWFVQMCLGLKHVHDRKILHRDIKTQNIFVSAGGLLKLGDFGVSKILASTWQLAATAVGTPYYLSPEICQNRRYNQKSDIWSLGCVLYELTVGRHAFEAPNMRALIQRIIKGQYPPVPATRSKELRDLIDRMLTVNWEKRPSINDILATSVMKARITKFLSATLQAHEFSHTVIHGKPERGHIVVQPAGLPAPAFAAAPAKQQWIMPAAQPAAVPVAVQPRAGALAAPAPAAAVAARPGSGSVASNRRGPSPAGANAVAAGAAAAAVAARQRAADAASAAKAKAQQAAKEREEAAAGAAAAAAARREDEGRRQRELAAVAAHREVERMKLEEQRKKIEAERARLESERKKAEAVRQDAERKARLAEEAARRMAAEDGRRRAEADARRCKAEEEAQRKEAERMARERKREGERAKMAAQKRDYYAKQNDAARNRAAVEQQLHNGQVQVFDAPAPRQRRQWQAPQAPEEQPGSAAEEPVRGASPLTPEQRRAVWEEQKAAAERNRRAAADAEQGGGLANFLGVPQEDAPQAAGKVCKRQEGPLAEDRRDFYQEQCKQADRNRRQAEEPPAHRQPPGPPVSVQEAFERRRRKLEDDAASREAQIREYQQAHWREMRDAAARNRAAIMAEMAVPGAAGAHQEAPQADGAADDSTLDFAAMIKDMQDVLGNESAEPEVAGACKYDGDEGEEDDDDKHAAARIGRFLLNGEEIALPVGSDDSLAAKVEALRCYLEETLGTQPFLKVYRRLESLSLEDDEAEISREFLAVLGPDRLPFLQLIHQLIVCEETLYAGGD